MNYEALHIGRAAIASAAANCKAIRLMFSVVKVLGRSLVRAGGVPKGAAPVRELRADSAPLADFFDYFLVQ